MFAFQPEKLPNPDSQENTITSINPANWLPLKKIEHPQITTVNVISQGPFDILEMEFSNKVKVVRKKQSKHFLQVRIIPAVKPIDYNAWLKLKNIFTNFKIKQYPEYTDLFVESKYRLSNPYTDIDAEGTFKIFIPYVVKEVALPNKDFETVSQGIEYHKDRLCVGNNKYSDIHILKIKLASGENRVYPALANEGLAQRETLSSMAKRHNAIAGINAGYFTSKGEPLGTLIIDRKIVSSPLYRRSVFGVTDKNVIVFGNPEFSGMLKAETFSVSINAVNQPRRGNNVVVYTSEYAKSTLTEEDGKEIILIKGKIVGFQTKNAAIPPDGIVVSAGGANTKLFENLKLGESIQIDYSVGSPWNTIKQAVCGGPRLVENGNISINDKEEKFNASIVTGRHPRTAIGLTFDGALIMLVVDGRSTQSAGMTLKEVALYMKRMGVRHAINLDGGGSTSMIVKGRIRNTPSDGSERKISNGLLILNP